MKTIAVAITVFTMLGWQFGKGTMVVRMRICLKELPVIQLYAVAMSANAMLD